MAAVLLKPGRERSVQRRHPWVFSGAVAGCEGSPSPGDTVEVLAHDRQWLARGFVNPASSITVHLATWEEEVALDEAWLHRRLSQAWQRRRALGIPVERDAFRLVYAESDFIPGLIVDCYADFVVAQLLIPAMARRRETIAALLDELLRPRGVFERSDGDAGEREGLPARVGPIRGDAPPERLVISEHGARLAVDLWRGHKTGMYLDQCDNRARCARYLGGARVLNAFSFTGAFAVHALRAGAERVINLDSSAEALRLAQENAALNACADRAQSLPGHAFQALRQYRDAGEEFDAIVLDPPRFAQSKGAVPRAARGYKDLNWLALRLLKPGGRLITFSCSGLVSNELFQQTLFAAALDAGREVQVIERLTQSRCHPPLITFPESEYLKGFVCRVE